MKKFKIFFTVVALLLTGASAFAQSMLVKGTVVDASTGEPVPYAAIQVQGTSTGTTTDVNGAYSISVNPKATLVFSSIGYISKDVPVAGRAQVDCALAVDENMLDETLVVAYGTQKKSSFTGSAKQLSGDKIKNASSTNISKSLEGAVAGLQTFSASGTPGSGSTMLIRGIGSVSASVAPLIVVDGVPYEESLNSIATQDIESLTVLKDAAANSMYGARGSNGVIIITTKRGDNGKIHVTFDAKAGVNSRAIPTYDVITDPAEYYELTWESLRNASYYGGGKSLAQAGLAASEELISKYLDYNIFKGVENNKLIDPLTGKINPAATTRKWNDNWLTDPFRAGVRQEYNFSASGGNDRTRAYMSASYLGDEGYTPNSGFDRISVRAKVDQNFNKWLSAGVNLSYSNTTQQTFSGSTSNNYSNIFLFSQTIAPIYPIYKYDLETGERQYGANGEVLYDWGETRPVGDNQNPLGQLMTSDYKTIRDNISTRGYIDIKILKDLKFTANLAFDVFDTRSNAFCTPVGGDAASVNGRGTQSMNRYQALNANQLLAYTPTFGDHSLNILLGHEIKSDNGYGLTGQKTNFVDVTNSDFNNGLTYRYLLSDSSSYFLQGYFVRAEYEYAGKYTVSGSYRRDGSSRFAPDRRWGAFWSVGASWNVKQEGFMSGVSAVDALRIKASYGTQGNDNIGYTKVYEDLYSITPVATDNGEVASLTKVFRAAPEVTWEKSKNFNVGFEGRFFDRVSVAADYFIKNIDDMIYRRPLAPSQGLPAWQLVNDMDMRNKGIEFEIGVDVIKNSDFLWNISLNGTHYKNEVTRLPSDKPQDGYATGSSWREVGAPLYNYYMYEWKGVDPTNGHPQFHGEKAKVDDDGNEILDKDGNPVMEDILVNKTADATRVKTGKSPIPDLYGGFTTTLRWKGFDLSAAFAYQIGGYTVDSFYQSLMTAGGAGDNWHKDIYRRWTPENTVTDVPRVQNDYTEPTQSSTRFLINSSYLSLTNLTIGYTIPSSITRRVNMQNLRVYVTGNNLWYTSNRKGLDVRQSEDGSTGYIYAALRTVSGGISLTF